MLVGRRDLPEGEYFFRPKEQQIKSSSNDGRIVGTRLEGAGEGSSAWINNSWTAVGETVYPVLEVAILHQSDIHDRLGFSWECVGFFEDHMVLQLYFEDPTYISTQLDPDALSLVFYDNSFFNGASQWPMWPMHIEKRKM